MNNIITLTIVKHAIIQVLDHVWIHEQFKKQEQSNIDDMTCHAQDRINFHHDIELERFLFITELLHLNI